MSRQFVITLVLGFSLISLQYGQQLNYIMIKILELPQGSSDDIDSTPHPCLGRKDNSSAVSVIPANTTEGPSPFGQLATEPSTPAPSTIIPTSSYESVTTSPTEALAPPAECSPLCARVIRVTWLSLPPFIFQPNNNTEMADGGITGVFFSIIGRAAQFCCKYLGDNGTGHLEYISKAENKDTLHASIFHDNASMGMPVYIENELFDQQYGGRLAFIKVLESPGLVVIGNKRSAQEKDLKVLWKVIYSEWPVVFISILLCAISGICVWALDTKSNEGEFPRLFQRGAFEGFWWAFVTMSTVGYGDKAPKSAIARVFCILWIIVGLTVCSVMTATLTTALATAAVRDVTLVGKKIAVLRGSPAFEEVVRRGGSPALFDNFDDMHKALVLNKTVTSIMDEMYSGLYRMQQVRDERLHVTKVIKRTRSYGFAFKRDDIFTWPVEDCIRNLILHRREDVYTVVKQFMDEIKDKRAVAMDIEEVGVLGGNSSAVRALVISLTIFLGALIGAILLGALMLSTYRNMVEAKDDFKRTATSVRSVPPKDEFLVI